MNRQRKIVSHTWFAVREHDVQKRFGTLVSRIRRNVEAAHAFREVLEIEKISLPAFKIGERTTQLGEHLEITGQPIACHKQIKETKPVAMFALCLTSTLLKRSNYKDSR
jgi:hypothetical protein